MRIIAAVDSFKGTLSSLDISKILKEQYEKDNNEVITVPISDGGEGFLDTIGYYTKKPFLEVPTYGPLMDEGTSHYIIDGHTAYVELSRVVGLNEISSERLNPLRTTTFGLGKLVDNILNHPVDRIVIGIGGSSTNDGGAGFLQAMGVQFFAGDQLMEAPMNGSNIANVTSINTDHLHPRLQDVEVILALDVSNPLLGENGCTNVYSKQKGATLEALTQLENAMNNFANVIENHIGRQIRHQPGMGAAGGFSFGVSAIFNAKITSGISFIIDLINLEEIIKNSDLVFVGEGRLDHQTEFGKAPMGVANLAKKHAKKVIGIFGSQENGFKQNFFDQAYVIVPKYADESMSMKNPKAALEKMLSEIKV